MIYSLGPLRGTVQYSICVFKTIIQVNVRWQTQWAINMLTFRKEHGVIQVGVDAGVREGIQFIGSTTSREHCKDERNWNFEKMHVFLKDQLIQPYPPFILWTSHRTKGGGWPFWIYFSVASLRINSPRKVSFTASFSHPGTPSPQGTKMPYESIRISRNTECFLLHIYAGRTSPSSTTWQTRSHLLKYVQRHWPHWMVLLSFHIDSITPDR